MQGTPRYEFGRNWSRFAEQLPYDALANAAKGLHEHVGELVGFTFLDVGSGSGLMSVAAIELGACDVLAFDFDPQSVETTKSLLEMLAPDASWSVRQGDVLTDEFGQWDTVYAWGVLHHTGDVRTAVRRAAGWVAPNGRLVVGIYLRTPMCRFWKREKRWYSNAPAWQRTIVRGVYKAGLVATWALKGQLWKVNDQGRGMSFAAAADDWLGGYPYESMTLDEIKRIIVPRGFSVEAEFPLPDHFGWFGTGCQTVRFRKVEAS